MTQRLSTQINLPPDADAFLRRALDDIFQRIIQQVNIGAAIDVDTVGGGETLGSVVNLVEATAATQAVFLVPAIDWVDRLLYVRSQGGVSLLVPQAGETVDGTVTARMSPNSMITLASDGDNWWSVGSNRNAARLVTERTAQSVSVLTLTATVRSGFKYRIEGFNARFGSASAAIVIDTLEGGGWSGDTDWVYGTISSSGNNSSTADRAWVVWHSLDSGSDNWFEAMIKGAASSGRRTSFISHNAGYIGGGAAAHAQVAGARRSATVATQFRLRGVGSGSTSMLGTFRVWEIPDD